jgi:D-sedoheptulose 7-phosphate isomerase
MLNKEKFIQDYLNSHVQNIFPVDISEKMINTSEILINADRKGKKLIFVGNGASAAIASHAALDFTKQAKIKAIAFNDATLLTAFSNDYGYENWVANTIEFYGEEGDVGIFISSSGKSQNILNGVKKAQKKDIKVITFSGFDMGNPLKKLGVINFHVNSRAYNVIENIHQIWIMGICDLIIGKMEYSVK